jgi:C_GCAxxG_C_C family probable redox protein
MMNKDKAQQAFETMASHKMNCAQVTFTAFCEDLGLEKKTALEMTQGFGGGMHIGGACGAATGAYMALGLANKISSENPRASMEKTNELIKEFNQKFKALHGSLNCPALAGYDFSQTGESDKARAKGVFDNVCPVLVRDAVKIAESLLKG